MTAIALVGWCAGWLLFVGMRRCARVFARSKNSQDVSVIVPARDEENNLPRLLDSITDCEVIVVDDCSTDRTPDVAREHGARVIAGTPLPNGWLGKTWACQQGGDAATGDLLLFIDADAWLERDALASIAADFKGGAMSIAPYHCVSTVREQFSAFFNLVMIAATGPRQLLGQSLLIERTIYEVIGGHGAVRDQLLENFMLGKELPGAVCSRLGRGALNIRMYPHGWREMIDGWSKGFAAGAARTSPLLLALTVVWMTGAIFAMREVATYALFALQLTILLRRIGSYRITTALLYPLPLFFFFAVFARSFFRSHTRESILWKGRPVRAA